MASVVIIENEAPLVRLLGWFLIDAGHQVFAVENVVAATGRITAEPADVVVFNSGLPASAKLPFVSEWRQLRPGIRVIDVARRAEPGARAPYTGADAYLQMPFDADDLIGTVDSVLALNG